MKTLVEYLADYILTEMDRQDDMSIYDTDDLKEWLKQGIDAYESTENCSIGIVGGDCPDCNATMEKGESVLYAECDEIEVVSYQCPECGYIVYG